MTNLVEALKVKDLKFTDTENSCSADKVAVWGDTVIEIIYEEDRPMNSDQATVTVCTEITDRQGTTTVGFGHQTLCVQGCYDDFHGNQEADVCYWDFFDFDLRNIKELPLHELKDFIKYMIEFQKVTYLAKREFFTFRSIEMMLPELRKLVQQKYFDYVKDLPTPVLENEKADDVDLWAYVENN